MGKLHFCPTACPWTYMTNNWGKRYTVAIFSPIYWFIEFFPNYPVGFITDKYLWIYENKKNFNVSDFFEEEKMKQKNN